MGHKSFLDRNCTSVDHKTVLADRKTFLEDRSASEGRTKASACGRVVEDPRSSGWGRLWVLVGRRRRAVCLGMWFVALGVRILHGRGAESLKLEIACKDYVFTRLPDTVFGC